MAHSEMPDRIYAELDPNTNDKRWYSTRGMGVPFVRAETHDRMGQYIARLENAIREQGFDVFSNLDGTDVSVRPRTQPK
jgi:hypothetical protein